MKFYGILFIMIMASFSLIAQVAITPATGDGTEQNPYEIASLENLYWIAASDDVVPNPEQSARWSSHYVQTADIDASDTENWFDGQGWSPIGFNWDVYFSGSYNGQSHTIEAIYINRPTTSFIGLFGRAEGAAIENLGLANVNINGGSSTGGLVGSLLDSAVNNIHISGSVNGNWGVGGLAGRQDSCTINNSCVSVSVSGTFFVGGLVGKQDESSIGDSYSTGNVNGSAILGGLVGDQGEQWLSSITNSYYNFEESLINGQAIVTSGALDGETFNIWLNNNLSLDINDHLDFAGDSFLINSIADLRKILAFGQYEEYSFRLTTDIDLEDHPSFFIPYFAGKFDGDGYEINNFTYNNAFSSFIGLFGLTSGATIENLGVTNVNVAGLGYIGGLVGFQWSSQIRNSNITGFVQGDSYIGGLVGGQDNNSAIINSYNTGTIDGFGEVGGLVGISVNNSLILNCFSEGDVSGYLITGGLVGFQEFSTISNSYATGVVICTDSHVGGIVGLQEFSTISNSYYSGNVFGSSDVGAIVGFQENSSIDNCYNKGTIYGWQNVGGLVGKQGESSIINSYSTGNISGYSSYGGLVGYQWTSTVTNSYWDTEASGIPFSADGEGRTTDEMTYPYAVNTYVDWDFVEIWSADVDYTINQGYPFLQEMPISIEEEFVTLLESPTLTNFPNPFNPETTISFTLPQETEKLELKIYNIRGQLVRTLIAGTPHSKGEYRIVWDGRNDFGSSAASGVYFYKVTTPSFNQINKMLLLK